MIRQASALFGVIALACFASACGGANGQSKAAQLAEDGRSRGFSKNDKARCEWRGRADREVSETTAAAALTPNIRRVYQVIGEGAEKRQVLVCREVDTNLDGVKDVMRTYNEKGETLREEADTDHDGRVDTWITFAKGRVAKQELDLNGDGKPDRWKFYTNGRLARIQRDTNKDGKPDVWEIFVRGNLERIGVDLDHDGRVDRWDRDELARLTTRTQESKSGGAKSNDDDGEAEPDDKEDTSEDKKTGKTDSAEGQSTKDADSKTSDKKK